MKKRKNASRILRKKITELLKKHKNKSLTVKQILTELGMQSQDRSILKKELKKMVSEGLLVKVDSGKYGLPERLDYLIGVLEGKRRGFAFLRPEQEGEDVFISSKNMSEAAHGDRVVVRLNKKRKGKKSREGTVIGILKKGQRRVVGTLYREGKRYFVAPEDQRFPGPIQVSRKDFPDVQNGDKVVVEVEKWSHGTRPSKGKIIEHFGPPGNFRTEELSFKFKFDLPGEHPEPVLKELETLPGEEDLIRLTQDQGRADLRSLKMVTIDDQKAKDFDDAVSLEPLPGGGFRLGVHIADVSHYVKEGKPLDREALKRGTSIYLADRVIHMLPPMLSEKMCSLQAGRDRLAVSVLMDIDEEGDLIDARFYESLIKVDERLTYQQVEAYLGAAGKDKDGGEDAADLFQDSAMAWVIDQMDSLARILHQKRLQRGALDLDLPEANIELDDNGVPLSVEKREMGRSESLIEEFMIYCNETVAEFLTEKELPCVYRIHTVPTEEKLAVLRETLTLMNVKAVANIREIKPKHLNILLEKTRGEKTEKLVRYLILRSLPQACYSASNEGHYGLASECYCHFTSPIRRYPDLVVHRILKKQLSAEGFTKSKVKRLQSRLPGIAQQSSERERAAVDAERASLDMKKAQYMEQKLGEVYTGIINGVTNFGFFVELDNTIEGMVPVTELIDDYYVYDEKTATLVGERTRNTYRLGDTIQVQVINANKEEGKVAFAPVEVSEIPDVTEEKGN
ncbi:MAG: ribonuclease R [Bacillota bacterium]